MNKLLRPLRSLLVMAVLCTFGATAQQVVTDVTSATPAQSAVTLPIGPVQPLAQWTSLPALPTARGYVEGAYLNGFVYVFGGLTASIEATSYKYNVGTSTWSSIVPMPKQRALPMVQAVGEKIYIMGGYSSGNPFTTEAPVFIYDPVQNTYSTGANQPTPTFGGASFVHDGKIYLLGGGRTSFQTQTDAIQIYDPATDSWAVSSSVLPRAIRAFGAAVVNGTVYMVGGYVFATQGTFFAEVHKGVISGNTIAWTKIADFPGGPIMRMSMGSNGSKIYLTGGYDINTNNTQAPSVKTWELDPAADTWKAVDPKITGVYYSTQMIHDGAGKFYVAGGTGATAYQSAFEVFNPAEEVTPKISVNKTSINDWVKLGAVAKFPFVIRNGGGALLNWTATGSQPWLSLSKGTGSTQPTSFDQLLIQVDASQLAVGNSSAKLTITSNDPATPSLDVNVAVRVQDADVDADLNVLLEEGTGTWCGYCPYGVDSINAVIAQYPGRVNVISYHGGSATEPLQTPHTTVWTGIIGLTGWPQGAVNRIQFEGETAMALSRGDWGVRINEVLNTRRSPLTITLTGSSYNAQTKATSLTFDVFFHRDVNVPVNLTVAQVQDGQIYSQVFYPSTGGSVRLPNFVHNHTMVQAIPGDAGEPLGANVTTQSKVTKTFNFTSKDSTINTSRFIVYAHQKNLNSYGEVFQSIEIPLSHIVTDVRPVPENASFTLHQNYPNPFNPSTVISYIVPTSSHVSIVVTDALGREVARPIDGVQNAGEHQFTFDASWLPSGTYYVSMRSGSFAQTRTMSLVK
jgi:N-acetylneuraminic acid mutarotase